MTVIAFDGEILAVDRQISYGDFAAKGRKCRRMRFVGDQKDSFAVWGGKIDNALMLLHWLSGDQDFEKFPTQMNNEDPWGELVLLRPDGRCQSYCQSPIPIEWEAPMAWGGAGRFAAMAAMKCGKTAIEAIEITCEIVDGCGQGVDFFILGEDHSDYFIPSD